MPMARSRVQEQEDAWAYWFRKATTQNLQLVKILPEKNILLIKGSVPGSKGTILTVRVAKKTKVSN